MKNKKGFAFIETIIIVVVLCSALLLLYSTYSAIISDEKAKIYYDDPAFIYYTNYVKNFLIEYANLDNIKTNYFNNTYIVTIGTGFDKLFYNTSYETSGPSSLETIVREFKINQIILVKTKMFNTCFTGKEDYCEYSLSSLSYNTQKYINSLNDTSSEYLLVVEYAIKYTDDGLEKCTPLIDSNCKTYYASISIDDKSIKSNPNLSYYIKSLYTGVQGENSIYYHDSSLTNGAGDNSYRYAGASSSVNNYVCFGSDEDTCPTENLYRIIGVIDGKVKLIKDSSLKESMQWDSNGANTWSTSSLNTYLNGTYLNTFSEDWQAKIATTTWKVGGISSSDVTASTMYTNEMNSTTSGKDGLTEYSSKVALMYAHDYGFAASPTAWTTTLVNYNGNDSAGTSITTNDWLYLGPYEWLVSRDSSHSGYSYLVFSSGGVSNYGDSVTFSRAVRPVFFLDPTITYLSGTGTSSYPIRIN